MAEIRSTTENQLKRAERIVSAYESEKASQLLNVPLAMGWDELEAWYQRRGQATRAIPMGDDGVKLRAGDYTIMFSREGDSAPPFFVNLQFVPYGKLATILETYTGIRQKVRDRPRTDGEDLRIPIKAAVPGNWILGIEHAHGETMREVTLCDATRSNWCFD